MWNRNIRVVIIPSILTLAFLGQSNSSFIQLFNKSLPLVLWLGGSGSVVYSTSKHHYEQLKWGNNLGLITITMSLAVNALVTGLIVFKIFKVYCEVKPFYGQSFGASGGSKLRLVIFILIESWMAFFCIQVARVVASLVSTQAAMSAAQPIIGIYQMFNVINIILSLYYLLILLITSVWLEHNTYDHPGAGCNGIVFPRREFIGRSYQQSALWV